MTAVDQPPTLTAAELAARHGLLKVGGRPPLHKYVAQIWDRRHFTITLARSRAYSRNTNSFLGQLWAFLTPMLWAGLYYLIFGMLLGTKGSIENFAVFLVCGIFLFRFVASGMNNAATSIGRNNGLIQSLQFPRGLIPMAYTTAELLHLLPAMIVLLAVTFLTGEPLRWQLVLLVPAVLLAYLFATGLAFICARLVAEVSDLANLLPFVTRAMMYVSGVFFPLSHFAQKFGDLGHVLVYQPLAVYLDLARTAVLPEVTATLGLWLWGAAWAVGTLAVGFVFFWHAEAKYGRG